MVAFVFALINLARRAANPAIDVLEADGNPGHSLLAEAPAGTPTAPGVVVIRMAAPLFFANGAVFGDAVRNGGQRGRGRQARRDRHGGGHRRRRHRRRGLRGTARLARTAGRSSWPSAASVTTPATGSNSSACSTDEQVFDTNREAVAALTTEEQP